MPSDKLLIVFTLTDQSQTIDFNFEYYYVHKHMPSAHWQHSVLPSCTECTNIRSGLRFRLGITKSVTSDYGLNTPRVTCCEYSHTYSTWQRVPRGRLIVVRYRASCYRNTTWLTGTPSLLTLIKEEIFAQMHLLTLQNFCQWFREYSDWQNVSFQTFCCFNSVNRICHFSKGTHTYEWIIPILTHSYTCRLSLLMLSFIITGKIS